jgi:hypothetical protein
MTTASAIGAGETSRLSRRSAGSGTIRMLFSVDRDTSTTAPCRVRASRMCPASASNMSGVASGTSMTPESKNRSLLSWMAR